MGNPAAVAGVSRIETALRLPPYLQTPQSFARLTVTKLDWLGQCFVPYSRGDNSSDTLFQLSDEEVGNGQRTVDALGRTSTSHKRYGEKTGK